MRKPHESSIDELIIRAWQSKAREHAARWPRGRRWSRELSVKVVAELGRRGFDVDLATELDHQIVEVDGHADDWRIFLDGDLLGRVVEALSTPFRSERITKVIGIEARGFLLGGAVARELGAGFAAVRKGGHLPGPKLTQRTSRADYRGLNHELRLQSSALARRDRVLLVDDWIEMGSQAAAAKSLVDQARATFVGTSVIVNQLPADQADQFGKLHFLVRYFPTDAK
jgi:adenine phosphoribosyltransferase